MALCRPGAIACALLWLAFLAPSGAQAACSDKTLRGMSDAGRSVATIAKRCGMSAAAVKEKLGVGDAKTDRAPPKAAAPRAADASAGSSPASSAGSSAAAAVTPSDVSSGTASVAPPPAAKPAAQTSAATQKHPPGTVLELCGCYGSMEYGFTEPNTQCVSGKAVATRCPGYCPVNRSPWRRICS